MKIFVSYSEALDQIIALRLQTMAAVYGLTVYVPPASSRQYSTPVLTPEVQQQLTESDVVLAVITHAPAASAVSEMNWALASGKLLIPIVTANVPEQFYARFQPHFMVDASLDPSDAIHNITRYLAEKQRAEIGSDAGKTALVAVAAIAVALLLLGGANSK